LFKQWLNKQYHQNFHRGIKEKPIDRYLKDIPNVKIKEIAANEADYYFFHTIYRTVKNDCTILFQNELYEVPARLMGKKIELRFPLDKPGDLRLFEDNRQTAVLKKLDKHFNAETTIKYSLQEENDV
jgi:hypothetical protein